MLTTVLMLSITILFCADNSEGQSCNNRIFQHGQYNYKISTNQVLISEALQLANREGSSLLVIEDESTERRVLDQMEMCDISEVWLGIEQIPTEYTLTDAGPWSWILGCNNNPDAGVISFQGCYEEDNDRDLPIFVGLSSSDITESSCTEACRNRDITYAAIQKITNGEYRCYCGQSYGKHGAATGCSYTCPGGTSHSCGGVRQNSVYYTGNSTLWGNWYQTFPTYDDSFPLCAYISRNSGRNNNYYLKDGQCRQRFSWICISQASDDGSCVSYEDFPHESSREGMCYYLSSETKLWEEAKHICRSIFGTLVVIRNEEEHRFLVDWLEMIDDVLYDDVWVLMTRQTFIRFDNNDAVCYSNFNARVRKRYTNVYIKRDDGKLLWKFIDTDDSQIKMAATITQSRIEANIETTERSTTYIEPSTDYTEQSTTYTEQSTTYIEPSTDYTEQSASYTEYTEQNASYTEPSTEYTEPNTTQISEEVSQSKVEGENEDGQSSFPAWLVAVIVILTLMVVGFSIGVVVYYWKRRKEEDDSHDPITEVKPQRKLRKKTRITNSQLRKAVLHQLKARETGSISERDNATDSSYSSMDYSGTTVQSLEDDKMAYVNISRHGSVSSSGTATSDSITQENSIVSTVSEDSTSSSNLSDNFLKYIKNIDI